MKRIIIYLSSIFLMVTLTTSCDSWFDVETRTIQPEEEVFSTKDGVLSVLANIYNRLPDYQRFEVGVFNDWDEAAGDNLNQGTGYNNDYKRYWDYDLIRETNLFIENVQKYGSKLMEQDYKFFIAEGRFLRAYVYFYMVQNMGGVPLITKSYEWDESNEESDYRFPRATESEVYNFICDEVDEIKDDLDARVGTIAIKTRATKGAALALKSRAALYAGSIAKYTEKRPALELKTEGWEAGIPASEADDFFRKSLDAAQELMTDLSDVYVLYDQKVDKAENFYEALTVKSSSNREIIFMKDYDGKNIENHFTAYTIPRSQRAGAGGSKINPTLNLVEQFETISDGEKPIKTNNSREVIENPLTDFTSNEDYVIYDNAEDIFADRDPRLFGSIITPGSSFRNKELQLWAGLAIRTGANSWEFKSVDEIFDLDDPTKPEKIYFDGRQMTGVDGPHASTTITNPQEVTGTGFLLRKYVDSKPGSEMLGNSDIAYVRFRFGEVLLNAAEAAYELGEKGNALEYINKIRVRAGMPELTKITSVDQIRRERTVELAFEGHRFYDVKRWRIGDQLFDGTSTTASSVLYGLWPYKVYDPGSPDDGKWIYRRVKAVRKQYPLRFQLHNYYSSIDQEVLNANPLLVKNPYQI